MRIKTLAMIAAAVVGLAWPAAAPMAHELKGRLRTTAGMPVVGAKLRAGAITGFRGEPFAADDLRGIARLQ